MTTEEESGQEAPETTLREDLEAAIEQVESETEGGDHSAADETPAATPESASQESGGEAAAGEGAPAEAGAGASDSYPDDATRYPTLTAERAEKPPEGWRPAAREGWSDLPEGVRREIHRRELDIATGMQEASDARQLHQEFTSLVQPYTALMTAEGARTPMEAVDGLFKTAATLRMGSAEQKANRLAQLAQHYGVDLELLDGALAAQVRGEPAPSGNGASGVDPALDRRLQGIEQFVQGLQGRVTAQQQEVEVQGAQSVEEFRQSAEFLDDVRLDMADILDLATNRNRVMSLQEAYDTACQSNPEIRAILAQRAAAEGAAGATAHVERKAAAAGAMSPGHQSGGAAPVSTGSLREDVERAYDAHTGDR